jgi:magnesium transporter
MARTRLYRNGDLVAEDFPLDDISGHLSDRREAGDPVVWVDLLSPSPQVYERVQREFGLHELAIEDASSPRERPKLSHYRGHLFLSAYQTSFDGDGGELTVCPVSAFITGRALITVHGDGFDVDGVVRRWDATAELAGHGVAYLVHGLLDVVVDGHFDAVQELDDALEALEDKLFEETPQAVREVQQRSFRLRRSLSHLRKVVLPMREVVNGLTASARSTAHR